MRELAECSGVPVATIKFYLRTGLLAPGERTSPNQARYTGEHVRRRPRSPARDVLSDLGRLGSNNPNHSRGQIAMPPSIRSTAPVM